jgi:hypothetical protein
MIAFNVQLTLSDATSLRMATEEELDIVVTLSLQPVCTWRRRKRIS